MPSVSLTRHLERFFPALGPPLGSAPITTEVPGATVRDLLDELERRHPGLSSYIVDETGHLRRHVNIFIGEEPISDRAHLSDSLRPDAHVSILQALSGG